MDGLKLAVGAYIVLIVLAAVLIYGSLSGLVAWYEPNS